MSSFPLTNSYFSRWLKPPAAIWLEEMKINHHQPLGGDLLRRFKLAVVARHGSWLLEGGVPGWIFVGLCCHIHLSASLSYFIAKNPTLHLRLYHYFAASNHQFWCLTASPSIFFSHGRCGTSVPGACRVSEDRVVHGTWTDQPDVCDHSGQKGGLALYIHSHMLTIVEHCFFRIFKV